ncbi:MAG: sterol desaturase family protein [Burkholderiaceae bacterium]|nr:sterol desaturase family protein [Burkholderiaceae bacterium]
MHWFAAMHTVLFESLVLPLLSGLGMLAYMEDAFDFTEWFLIGALEMAFLALVIVPLERYFPAERRGPGGVGDRLSIDLTYTLLHRLGGFSILVFAVLQPLVFDLKQIMRDGGLPTLELDAALGLAYSPIWAALLYVLILDFVDYWIHRAQHRWDWWWALHAIHHSQRRMTLWTDNRNHLLDDLLRDAILAFVALLIGVAPSQFVGIVVFTRIWQSLQHANLGLPFPAAIGRLLVSPAFHRLHHGVTVGHQGDHRGLNFAVLFPVWDMLFRTADWSGDRRFAAHQALQATGIEDQSRGVDYGSGFWSQQWIGLRNLVQSVLGMSKGVSSG